MVEIIGKVDVRDMTAWIKAIPFEEWPQQNRLADGGIRPAMVTDIAWHGFGVYAAQVIAQIETGATEIRQLMLSVVMPGHEISPHIDQQPPNWLYRVHVPLITNPKAVTVMKKRHHMSVGKAYKLDTRETHSVINEGKTPRVHFMFDALAL